MRNLRKYLSSRRLRDQRRQIGPSQCWRVSCLQSMRSPVSWRRNSGNWVSYKSNIFNLAVAYAWLSQKLFESFFLSLSNNLSLLFLYYTPLSKGVVNIWRQALSSSSLLMISMLVHCQGSKYAGLALFSPGYLPLCRWFKVLFSSSLRFFSM